MRRRQNWIFVAYFLFQHLMNFIICLMILNRVKLELAVALIKYIASVVPLIVPPKKLIWNKMVLPSSNLLKVLELVENVLEQTFSESI